MSIQVPQSSETPENKVFHKTCFSFPSHWVSEFKHWQFPVPSFLVSLLQVGFHYPLNKQRPLSGVSIVLRSFLWLPSLITATCRSFMAAQRIAETWGSGSLPGKRVTLGSLSEKSVTFFFSYKWHFLSSSVWRQLSSESHLTSATQQLWPTWFSRELNYKILLERSCWSLLKWKYLLDGTYYVESWRTLWSCSDKSFW